MKNPPWKSLGIDSVFSREILDKLNQGLIPTREKSSPAGLPSLDDEQITDLGRDIPVQIQQPVWKKFLKRHEIDESVFPSLRGTDPMILQRRDLVDLGVLLYPFLGFGVLNGGSATSYFDNKKNKAIDSRLYTFYRDLIEDYAQQWNDSPKGITPAVVDTSGKPGPSFMELKLRSLLIESLKYQQKTGKKGGIRFYQMSSQTNHEQLLKSLSAYRDSPFLKALIEETGIDITDGLTASQSLISTFSRDSSGKYHYFDQAYGESGRYYPLPGGHGQCFRVLRPLFQQMKKEGIRYIYLGNVDNCGYLPDPEALARLALSGKPAAFECTLKTPVDIKGGVLVRTSDHRLSCVDMGVGISNETIAEEEKRGKSVLFNAATGLFNLDYLLKNIDRIQNELPMRISMQNKDAGIYFQVEQVTWEVMGLIDDPLIFAVDKYRRFLPAKMFAETLLGSGYGFDTELKNLELVRRQGSALHRGIRRILTEKLALSEGSWEPIPVKEIKRDYH